MDKLDREDSSGLQYYSFSFGKLVCRNSFVICSVRYNAWETGLFDENL